MPSCLAPFAGCSAGFPAFGRFLAGCLPLFLIPSGFTACRVAFILPHLAPFLSFVVFYAFSTFDALFSPFSTLCGLCAPAFVVCRCSVNVLLPCVALYLPVCGLLCLAACFSASVVLSCPFGAFCAFCTPSGVVLRVADSSLFGYNSPCPCRAGCWCVAFSARGKGFYNALLILSAVLLAALSVA